MMALISTTVKQTNKISIYENRQQGYRFYKYVNTTEKQDIFIFKCTYQTLNTRLEENKLPNLPIPIVRIR